MLCDRLKMATCIYFCSYFYWNVESNFQSSWLGADFSAWSIKRTESHVLSLPVLTHEKLQLPLAFLGTFFLVTQPPCCETPQPDENVLSKLRGSIRITQQWWSEPFWWSCQLCLYLNDSSLSCHLTVITRKIPSKYCLDDTHWPIGARERILHF